MEQDLEENDTETTKATTEQLHVSILLGYHPNSAGSPELILNAIGRDIPPRGCDYLYNVCPDKVQPLLI